MVTRNDALFLMDRHAPATELGADERAELRREHARRGWTKTHSECFEAALPTAAEKRVGRGGKLRLKHVAQTAAMLGSR